MEFFQEVYSPDFDVNPLKELITIDSLTRLCASINDVTANKDNEADIYCIWGAFNLRREEIRYGVRFSLLNCPHALAWTITLNKVNNTIIIHCTIDKTEQNADSDFVESIHDFVQDWSKGITKALQ